MNKLSDIIDVKTFMYLTSTLFVIISGWFGLKERVEILAGDVRRDREMIVKQEEYFQCLRKDVRNLQDSVIRIQVLLEKYLHDKQ
ncbi:MAG: hypothetical protein RBU23_12620 [Candidatus Auribacterota bacterium]|jgi:hypothetical protein|nr:hypothetical protein [Candidatus Auribacterota bacterium]